MLRFAVRREVQRERRCELSNASHRSRAATFLSQRFCGHRFRGELYHEARKLARDASPDMMRELIELAKTAEDERVRSAEIQISTPTPYMGIRAVAGPFDWTLIWSAPLRADRQRVRN